MKKKYIFAEKYFEKFTAAVTSILGNSITFILALCLVAFWLCNRQFYMQNIHDSIRDIILGIAFLTLFIIQKSFNRFSASLHLKLNELVASHETADNAVIDTEEKTEQEITELSKEYTQLAEQVKNGKEK